MHRLPGREDNEASYLIKRYFKFKLNLLFLIHFLLVLECQRTFHFEDNQEIMQRERRERAKD